MAGIVELSTAPSRIVKSFYWIYMKRILINATQSEELRVAIVDAPSQELLDILVERQSYKTKTGNIYMSKITTVEPSLDACFVNFGSERHGFLPFKEVAPNYLSLDASKTDHPPIKDVLKEGQKVMVQVEKEERGNKGAALTTFISLAGSYLVLMPNNPRAGGISRRVEGGDRSELREILSNLHVPEDMGVIIRTAGVGKALEDLQWDLTTLLKQWEAIQKATTIHTPPFLIHQESDVLIRVIRDYLREDVFEILVDNREILKRIKNYLEQIKPEFIPKVKLYDSSIPLFNRYQIEHQIEAAHEREVRLPSGGSIVIGHTEALVAIDVNSGQATKGKDIEQTALEINKEAARVIARQLRIRDIGGLIVIDFIDMPSVRHRRDVENELRNALKMDKARTQIGAISTRFGLLEMSRQRLRQSLGEATRLVCPRCDGWGSIRGVESLSLSIIRVIEEDAIRPGTAQIHVQVPIEVATFIINEKRGLIASIEGNHQVQIIIIPNPKLESPHYRVKRITENETSGSGKVEPSYRVIEKEELEIAYNTKKVSQETEEKPVVKNFLTEKSADNQNRSSNSEKTASASFIKKLLANLFGSSTAKEPIKKISLPNAKIPVSTKQHPEISTQKTLPSIPSQQRRSRSTATSEKPQKRNVTNNSQSTRPPRNARNPGNFKRSNFPPLTKTAKPTELPKPPDYLQSSLSDADLENYYQESTGFSNRKSPKKDANALPAHKTTNDSLLPTAEKSKLSGVTNPVSATAAISVSVQQTNITESATTTSIAAHSTMEGAKIITQEKLWIPHKVVSATPSQTQIPQPTKETDQKSSKPFPTDNKKSVQMSKHPRHEKNNDTLKAQIKPQGQIDEEKEK